MRRIRPAAFEDQMSLVDHLDELRARLVTCLSVFVVALALCFWQNHLLLEIANAPLPKGHEQLLTLGIVRVDQITKNRRYAYLGLAVLAAALPGVDPISMLLELVPLLVLFELSILLAKVFDRRRATGGVAEPST